MKRAKLVWVFTLFLVMPFGCKNDRAPADQSPAEDGPVVIGSGRFQSVGKQVSGAVELRKSGDDYELRLVGVTLNHEGEAHVYLVGLDRAPNTRAVDDVELKYDMGPLENGKPEQIIPLPSKPDPALGSVVLWNPKYGANLATASLARRE